MTEAFVLTISNFAIAFYAVIFYLVKPLQVKCSALFLSV